jgi:hypothetical protein
MLTSTALNPLNAELNPICHLLALLAHTILHVGRIRVNQTIIQAVCWHFFLQHFCSLCYGYCPSGGQVRNCLICSQFTDTVVNSFVYANCPSHCMLC